MHTRLCQFDEFINNNHKSNNFIPFEFISNHLKSVLTEGVSQINWNCISNPKKNVIFLSEL